MPDLNLSALQKALSSAALEPGGAFGPVVRLPLASDLPATCQQLRSQPEPGIDVLEDYTALDLGEGFELVLHLVSSADVTRRLTVKAPVSRQTPEAPSLVACYGSAEWYEREIFDMFGIRFTGHPDLRRILLPEDWEGYPLRKDYSDDKLLKRPGN